MALIFILKIIRIWWLIKYYETHCLLRGLNSRPLVNFYLFTLCTRPTLYHWAKKAWFYWLLHKKLLSIIFFQNNPLRSLLSTMVLCLTECWHVWKTVLGTVSGISDFSIFSEDKISQCNIIYAWIPAIIPFAYSKV